MDGGINLLPEEIMGRNTWNLWSGRQRAFLESRRPGQFRSDGSAEDAR